VPGQVFDDMQYYSFYFPFTFLPIILVAVYFLFEERLVNRNLRWLWWGLSVAILVFVGFYVIKDHALYDFFKGYYHGGRKILRNPDVLYDETCYGYVNFPLFARLFIPLANLEKRLAGRIFYLFGYIAMLPLGYYLVSFTNIKGWRRFAILGFLLLSGPLDYNIWLGNVTQVITLMVLLALVSYKRGWEWVSGLILGAAGLVKLPLVIPSGYFFIRRKWNVVGGGLLVAGIVVVLSLIMVPVTLNTTWLDRCILLMGQSPTAAYNNQSLIAFLARIFMPGNTGWNLLTPTPEYTIALTIGRILLTIPLLFVLFYRMRSARFFSDTVLEFSILLTFSLLTSPISWTHYFILMFIPIAWYFGEDASSLRSSWMSSLLLISVSLLSVPKDLSLTLFKQTGNALLLSAQFYGSVVMYVFLIIAWGMSQKIINKTAD